MDAFSENADGRVLGFLGTVDGEKPVSNEDLLISTFLTDDRTCQIRRLHVTQKQYIDSWRECAQHSHSFPPSSSNVNHILNPDLLHRKVSSKVLSIESCPLAPSLLHVLFPPF